MNVFLIHTSMVNKRGESIFISFATNCTLDQLEAKLNDGRLVSGFRLFTKFTRDDVGKCLEVIEQKPMLIGKAGITSIEIPDMRYVKFSEDAPQ